MSGRERVKRQLAVGRGTLPLPPDQPLMPVYVVLPHGTVLVTDGPYGVRRSPSRSMRV
ncbi:hypothetical protein [Streptomyces sp. NPDC050988]|uniref:hypothetical protein n=1 Tax=Streptomyces sp. NPDC050988 TaxID=3365637 RepID=UPI0037B03EE5